MADAAKARHREPARLAAMKWGRPMVLPQNTWVRHKTHTSGNLGASWKTCWLNHSGNVPWPSRCCSCDRNAPTVAAHLVNEDGAFAGTVLAPCCSTCNSNRLMVSKQMPLARDTVVVPVPEEENLRNLHTQQLDQMGHKKLCRKCTPGTNGVICKYNKECSGSSTSRCCLHCLCRQETCNARKAQHGIPLRPLSKASVSKSTPTESVRVPSVDQLRDRFYDLPRARARASWTRRVKARDPDERVVLSGHSPTEVVVSETDRRTVGEPAGGPPLPSPSEEKAEAEDAQSDSGSESSHQSMTELAYVEDISDAEIRVNTLLEFLGDYGLSESNYPDNWQDVWEHCRRKDEERTHQARRARSYSPSCAAAAAAAAVAQPDAHPRTPSPPEHGGFVREEDLLPRELFAAPETSSVSSDDRPSPPVFSVPPPRKKIDHVPVFVVFEDKTKEKRCSDVLSQWEFELSQHGITDYTVFNAEDGFRTRKVIFNTPLKCTPPLQVFHQSNIACVTCRWHRTGLHETWLQVTFRD